jgi:hypothetical protein
MAQMKAASLSLYFLHRDFDVAARDGSDGKEAAPGVGGTSARNVSLVLKDYMRNVRLYLMLERASPDTEHEEGVIHYNRCIVDFSSLSVLNERLAFRANYANGAMNRANEYLRGACRITGRGCTCRCCADTPTLLCQCSSWGWTSCVWCTVTAAARCACNSAFAACMRGGSPRS